MKILLFTKDANNKITDKGEVGQIPIGFCVSYSVANKPFLGLTRTLSGFT
jgi:hypothetical protein